jgi:hypothetical protein
MITYRFCGRLGEQGEELLKIGSCGVVLVQIVWSAVI